MKELHFPVPQPVFQIARPIPRPGRRETPENFKDVFGPLSEMSAGDLSIRIEEPVLSPARQEETATAPGESVFPVRERPDIQPCSCAGQERPPESAPLLAKLPDQSAHVPETRLPELQPSGPIRIEPPALGTPLRPDTMSMAKERGMPHFAARAPFEPEVPAPAPAPGATPVRPVIVAASLQSGVMEAGRAGIEPMVGESKRRDSGPDRLRFGDAAGQPGDERQAMPQVGWRRDDPTRTAVLPIPEKTLANLGEPGPGSEKALTMAPPLFDHECPERLLDLEIAVDRVKPRAKDTGIPQPVASDAAPAPAAGDREPGVLDKTLEPPIQPPRPSGAAGTATSPAQQILSEIAKQFPQPAEAALSAWPPGASKTLRIQLHPENLGLVTVTMRQRKDTIIIRLEVQSADTAELISRDRLSVIEAMQRPEQPIDLVIVAVDRSQPAETPTPRSTMPFPSNFSQQGWGNQQGGNMQAGHRWNEGRGPRHGGARQEDDISDPIGDSRATDRGAILL